MAFGFDTPQAFSGGIDFTPLSKLGDIYQQGRERAAQQAALARLGNDPTVNAQLLIQSGVPSLAKLGMDMMDTQATRAEHIREWEAANRRAEASEARQQGTYEKATSDEEAAAKLISGLLPGQTAPQTPDVFTRGAPPIIGSPATMPAPLRPGEVPVSPNAPGQPAVPLAAGQSPDTGPAVPFAQAPSPNAPDQLMATGALAARAPVADRIAANLTSGQPAAAAGVSRDQIADLYRNPLTRPLATAFLQKQFSPDSFKFEKTDDGRIIAINERTTKATDITPPTASGQPPPDKQQREREQRYADAIARGYDKDTANYVAINGKLPKEDLTPTEIKAVTDAQKQVTSGQDVLDNIKRLRELSPTAWSGWGASKRASIVNALLPNDLIPQGAVDAKELSNLALQNVAGQAKAMFGSRLAVAEVKLLNELETTPEMSDAERQRIYTRIERLVQRHVDAASAEAEGIRNRTYFKPGGGQQAAPQAEAPTPTSGPTLKDFMVRAREANPNASDSELANYWNKKYGNR